MLNHQFFIHKRTGARPRDPQQLMWGQPPSAVRRPRFIGPLAPACLSILRLDRRRKS